MRLLRSLLRSLVRSLARSRVDGPLHGTGTIGGRVSPERARRARGWAGSVALVALLLPAVAHALPQTLAAEFSLGVRVPGQGVVALGTATGSVSVLDGAVSFGEPLGIAAGAVSQTAAAAVPVTSTTALASVSFQSLRNRTGLATQTLSGIAGYSCGIHAGPACIGFGPQLSMGLSGTLNLVLLPNVIQSPVDLAAAGVGVGGSLTGNALMLPLEIQAAPWVAGSAYVSTGDGGATSWLGTITGEQTNFDTTITWSRVSSVTFVSPAYVALGDTVVPLFFTFGIAFVPEPGTALLLAGAAGLWLCVRRRDRGSPRAE